jgi:DNA-directed RNA polymerase subunit K/omega
MIHRPAGTGALEFAVVSGLRAAQLMRGCRPRVESSHKVITTAQMEVAAGKVSRIPHVPLLPPLGDDV